MLRRDRDVGVVADIRQVRSIFASSLQSLFSNVVKMKIRSFKKCVNRSDSKGS